MNVLHYYIFRTLLQETKWKGAKSREIGEE